VPETLCVRNSLDRELKTKSIEQSSITMGVRTMLLLPTMVVHTMLLLVVVNSDSSVTFDTALDKQCWAKIFGMHHLSITFVIQ
jgi:hypothetical protein